MRIALLLSALPLLAACVTETVTPTGPAPELSFSSAIATREPGFQPKTGTRLGWTGELVVSAPVNFPVDGELVAYTQQQISSALAARGYTVLPANAAANADYLLMGLVLLGDDINDQTLRDKLGFDPGISTGHTGLQKGSVVLLIKDANTRLPQWPAVVQMLLQPELAKDERELRVRKGAEKLVSSLPVLTAAP